MSANRADHAVTTMCRVLDVSTSGYYAWRRRSPSKRARENHRLGQEIRAIHDTSRGTYGVPRVHAELVERRREAGVTVSPSRNRIARLMRLLGLQGVTRRKRYKTTVRDHRDRVAPDLVDRQFVASGPDALWVADITYVPTWVGFLFLAVVLDVWSRRVVGWAMASHLRTELVLDALEMAIMQRRPTTQTIFHSDQGSQYTSIEFGKRCREAGIRPSTGSVADCYDNAMCESFFATLECELIDRTAFPNHQIATREVFSFIEGWYNPHRRHSALGYLSPAQFERRTQQDRRPEPGILN